MISECAISKILAVAAQHGSKAEQLFTLSVDKHHILMFYFEINYRF